MDEVDAGPGEVHHRPAERVLVQLDSVHIRVRDFGRNRESHRSGAGAEVDDDRALQPAARQVVDHPAGQDLSLRSRDEDAWPHLELDVPERGAAGEVLQRDAVEPSADQRLVRVRLDLGSGQQLAAAAAEEVCRHRLRVVAG